MGGGRVTDPPVGAELWGSFNGIDKRTTHTAVPRDHGCCSHRGDRDGPGAPPVATGASGVGWPGFGLWLKSHGLGKAFGMQKGGTRQVNC